MGFGFRKQHAKTGSVVTLGLQAHPHVVDAHLADVKRGHDGVTPAEAAMRLLHEHVVAR